MKKCNRLLGEMLVEKGFVDQDQVETTVEEQRRVQDKKFIGEMIVEKGLVDQDDLSAVLAAQFSIGYVRLSNIQIDWEVPTGFSSSFINKHKCIPMRVDEETIMLAITNPLDVWIIEMAEKEAAPSQLKIVLTEQSDIDAAIKEYKKYSLQKMMNRLRKTDS